LLAVPVLGYSSKRIAKEYSIQCGGIHPKAGLLRRQAINSNLDGGETGSLKVFYRHLVAVEGTR